MSDRSEVETALPLDSNLGAGHAAAISNAYHPAGDRTLTNNLNIWWMNIAGDAAVSVLREFWPDLKHKLHK